MFAFHMLRNYASKILRQNIRDDETIVHIIRSHPLKHIIPAFAIFVLIFGPLFFLLPLLSFGEIGILILSASFLLGLILLLRELYIWSLHAFVVTDQRIIDFDQTGFFHRTVSESRFDKIQDVSYTQNGLLQTFFRVGTLVIQTAGESANLEIDYVYQPEKLQKLLIQVQMEFLHRRDRDELS